MASRGQIIVTSTRVAMWAMLLPLLGAGDCATLSLSLTCPADTIALGETFTVTITVSGGDSPVSATTVVTGGDINDPTSLTPTITPLTNTVIVSSTATDSSGDELTDECTVFVEGGPCDTDSDCPDDGDLCTTEICTDNTCTSVNVDCGDQLCDPSTGDCVDCLTDDDCINIGLCLGGECLCLCYSDEDCDDGLFCNGSEACVVWFCEEGTPPCAQQCDEQADMCTEN